MKKIVVLILVCIAVMLASVSFADTMYVLTNEEINDAFLGEGVECITLNGDLVVDNDLIWKVRCNTTFDLNGHIFDLNSHELKIWIYEDDCTVTFTDSSLDQSGRFKSSAIDNVITVSAPGDDLGGHDYEIVFYGGVYENDSDQGTLIYLDGDNDKEEILTFKGAIVKNYLHVYNDNNGDKITIESLIIKNESNLNKYVTQDNRTTNDVLGDGCMLHYYEYNSEYDTYYNCIDKGTTDKIEDIIVFKGSQIEFYGPTVYNFEDLCCSAGNDTLLELSLGKDIKTCDSFSFSLVDNDRIIDMNGHEIVFTNDCYINFLDDGLSFTFSDTIGTGLLKIEEDHFFYIEESESNINNKLIFESGNYQILKGPLALLKTGNGVLNVYIYDGSFYLKSSSSFNCDEWNYYIKNMNIYAFEPDDPVGILNCNILISAVIDGNSEIYVNCEEWNGDRDTTFINSIYSWNQYIDDPTIMIKYNKKSLKGDLDGNGIINISDVRVLLQKYINSDSSTELTSEEKETMDFNDDGKIDIYDVRMLLQIYINL